MRAFLSAYAYLGGSSYSYESLGRRMFGVKGLGGTRLVSEKERWEMRLERLQNRTEKVRRELVKSSLTARDKAELYGSFWGFIGGLGVHLEEQFPELKVEH
jgi:hypothetical protein